MIEIDPGEIQQLQHGRLLFGCRLEERPDVPPRDHQRVPGRHREAVAEGEREIALEDETVARQAAERAMCVHGSLGRSVPVVGSVGFCVARV